MKKIFLMLFNFYVCLLFFCVRNMLFYPHSHLEERKRHSTDFSLLSFRENCWIIFFR
jgi:hypothetical protein